MMGSIVCFGEMLLRYAPAPDGEDFGSSAHFAVHVAGAEANVAIALAAFGSDARMVTLLPDNPLGARARATLQAHEVGSDFCLMAAGRIGSYFVEDPRGGREAGYFYDRAHSVFALSERGSIDWSNALAGASWLHVSGITAALGRGPLELLDEAMDKAQQLGIRISFDCNFRPLLWAGREHEAPAVLRSLALKADLVFATAWDEQFVLGGQYAEGGLFSHSDRLALIAATGRRVVDGAEQLAATLRTRTGEYHQPFTTILPYFERLGAGDAFAAGLLHGLDQGWSETDCLAFAHRACLKKHGIPGDFCALSVAAIAGADLKLACLRTARDG